MGGAGPGISLPKCLVVLTSIDVCIQRRPQHVNQDVLACSETELPVRPHSEATRGSTQDTPLFPPSPIPLLPHNRKTRGKYDTKLGPPLPGASERCYSPVPGHVDHAIRNGTVGANTHNTELQFTLATNYKRGSSRCCSSRACHSWRVRYRAQSLSPGVYMRHKFAEH